MLGYQANAQWRDMSDFVVHFTKPGPPYHDAYQNMMSILGARTLIPGAEGFGIARREAAVADRHRSVCFSEIPLDQLSRLVQRRSLYGIAFRKSFILSQGEGRSGTSSMAPRRTWRCGTSWIKPCRRGSRTRSRCGR